MYEFPTLFYKKLSRFHCLLDLSITGSFISTSSTMLPGGQILC